MLKNQGLNLKELFVPDDCEQYKLLELDIAAAELRVLTAYSRDEGMIAAFNEGKDLHSLTAAGISDYTYEQIRAKKEDKDSDEYRKRQLGKKVDQIGLL